MTQREQESLLQTLWWELTFAGHRAEGEYAIAQRLPTESTRGDRAHIMIHVDATRGFRWWRGLRLPADAASGAQAGTAAEELQKRGGSSAHSEAASSQE